MFGQIADRRRKRMGIQQCLPTREWTRTWLRASRRPQTSSCHRHPPAASVCVCALLYAAMYINVHQCTSCWRCTSTCKLRLNQWMGVRHRATARQFHCKQVKLPNQWWTIETRQCHNDEISSQSKNMSLYNCLWWGSVLIEHEQASSTIETCLFCTDVISSPSKNISLYSIQLFLVRKYSW